MAELEIRRIDDHRVDPGWFDALAVVYREVYGEYDPDDPTPSDREVVADLFSPAPDRTVWNYVACVDGEPAGMVRAGTMSEPGDDLQVTDAEVLVRRAHRRRGVASALLAELLPVLATHGQTSLMAFPCEAVTLEAAEALCRRLGLTLRAEERCSRAKVADIDDDLLATWVAEAATRASGYRLEQWEGPVPDRWGQQWAEAMAAMNDAPLDDLDYNPYVRPAETQRLADERMVAQGFRIHRALALSAEGEPAGMTELYVHEDRPQLGHQSDTGVLAGHRGHGLGRWLKAANYRRVRAAHPELAVIQTYNAESNPWMLDINVAMGFRPHHRYVGYQGSIETAAAALGVTDRAAARGG